MAGTNDGFTGRLPNCNQSLAHASISRYHCVLQFGDDNCLYAYDLGRLVSPPKQPKHGRVQSVRARVWSCHGHGWLHERGTPRDCTPLISVAMSSMHASVVGLWLWTCSPCMRQSLGYRYGHQVSRDGALIFTPCAPRRLPSFPARTEQS